MRGLQFHDVRVLQSDLGFVDYHRRSTRELINRRREREREFREYVLHHERERASIINLPSIRNRCQKIGALKGKIGHRLRNYRFSRNSDLIYALLRCICLYGK